MNHLIPTENPKYLAQSLNHVNINILEKQPIFGLQGMNDESK